MSTRKKRRSVMTELPRSARGMLKLYRLARDAAKCLAMRASGMPGPYTPEAYDHRYRKLMPKTGLYKQMCYQVRGLTGIINRFEPTAFSESVVGNRAMRAPMVVRFTDARRKTVKAAKKAVKAVKKAPKKATTRRKRARV